MMNLCMYKYSKCKRIILIFAPYFGSITINQLSFSDRNFAMKIRNYKSIWFISTKEKVRPLEWQFRSEIIANSLIVNRSIVSFTHIRIASAKLPSNSRNMKHLNDYSFTWHHFIAYSGAKYNVRHIWLY